MSDVFPWLHLSKVRFRNTVTAQKALLASMERGSYQQHQLLWKLFPGGEQREFLFRHEMSVHDNYFFVLSRRLPEQNTELFAVESKVFNPQLHNGDSIGYRMMLNPTIYTRDPSCPRGVRHDVMMHAKKRCRDEGEVDAGYIKTEMYHAAQDWVMDPRRQADWGVRIDVRPDIISSRDERCFKNLQLPDGSRRRNEIRFSMVDYQGILQIRDIDLFRRTLQKGIGRSKAFGCGLMLIRRL